MSYNIIKSEFLKSMSKSLAVHAKELEVSEDEIQIRFFLKNGDDLWETGTEQSVSVDYKIFKDFVPVPRMIELSDLLHINPIYKIFKGQIEKTLLQCLIVLRDEYNGSPSVFVMKSKTPDKIRLVLYINGKYRCDITEDDILRLKQR